MKEIEMQSDETMDYLEDKEKSVGEIEMEFDGTIEKVKTRGEIELEFIETMDYLEDKMMSAEEIRKDRKLYNEIAEKSYDFFARVALLSKKNIAIYNAMNVDFELLVDDSLLYFLNNIDYVLSVKKEGRIKCIVDLINKSVINSWRWWIKNESSNNVDIDTLNEDFSTCTICEADEIVLTILSVLIKKAKPYDAVSFMATKILGWKTGHYADMLLTLGYEKAVKEVIKGMKKELDIIDIDVFKRIIVDARKNEKIISSVSLAPGISRSSDRAKNALVKALKVS